ncbi:sporulation peptidase YabG [Oceanirhabdus seepicola]|uniref:Sporulation peptidase YabG n=1 Tax=Oceanirhabdus seepicola TaxID=2828781 RepID=A0A9J6P0W4_9CLOT|nr:sporulation peptidase YabG [Oceanirhabdus seepicola]MCM1990036.1 sporulation peptidase YabG [Oceanirhabdus seepicola]
MNIGDIVVRKSYDEDITFKVIGIREDDQGKEICELKGVNIRIEADSPIEDLKVVHQEDEGKADKVFNEKINQSIKKVIAQRNGKDNAHYVFNNISRGKDKSKKGSKTKEKKTNKEREMIFGRPGRILHVDGDSEYLEVCLKTYKELSLEVVGKAVKEADQPNVIVDLVRQVKPDIIVITGHDSMVKNAKDYTDLSNYRNSKYFVQCVLKLRNYEPNYDDLVIFAGACQSNYEALLDAGANYASSPNRVLIHCLDPVMVCEKVAYSNIKEIVAIKDIIDSTITGIKGIGGLETRGKYREGYPKSIYLK